jgi:hypothetical protein
MTGILPRKLRVFSPNGIGLAFTGVGTKQKSQNNKFRNFLALLLKLVTHVSQTWNTLLSSLVALDARLEDLGIECVDSS